MKHNLPATSIRTNFTDMCVKLFRYFSVLWVFLLVAQLAIAQPGLTDFKSGEDLRKKKQYKEAVDAYDRAINAEPNNDKYWFRKGQALYGIGDPASVEAAINAYKKSIDLNKNRSAYHVTLAKTLGKLKKYDEAVKYCRSGFDVESNQDSKISIAIMECKFLLSLDKTGDALSALSKAKAIQPEHMKVLGMEGEIYLRDNKPDQAVASFQKAYGVAEKLKNKGSMGLYKYKMATAYLAAGKKTEAEKECADLAKDPGWAKYKLQCQRAIKGGSTPSKNLRLASAYIKVNEFDQAKKYINDAITEGKNPVLAYEMMAILHTKAGETLAAITSYQKAAGATNDPAAIQKINSKMVRLQINNGDYPGALSTATKLIGNGGPSASNPTLNFYKAIAEYKTGQFTNCISTLETIVSKMSSGGGGSGAGAKPTGDMNAARYYFLMGLAAKKANQNAKAIEAFKKSEVGSFKSASTAEIQALSGK